MADEAELARKHTENEIKRSRVRQLVTYSVIWAYLGLAAVVTLWLMWAGRYEVAIGVLAGVAGLAGSITGFWFGSPRAGASRSAASAASRFTSAARGRRATPRPERRYFCRHGTPPISSREARCGSASIDCRREHTMVRTASSSAPGDARPSPAANLRRESADERPAAAGTSPMSFAAPCERRASVHPIVA